MEKVKVFLKKDAHNAIKYEFRESDKSKSADSFEALMALIKKSLKI